MRSSGVCGACRHDACPRMLGCVLPCHAVLVRRTFRAYCKPILPRPGVCVCVFQKCGEGRGRGESGREVDGIWPGGSPSPLRLSHPWAPKMSACVCLYLYVCPCVCDHAPPPQKNRKQYPLDLSASRQQTRRAVVDERSAVCVRYKALHLGGKQDNTRKRKNVDEPGIVCAHGTSFLGGEDFRKQNAEGLGGRSCCSCAVKWCGWPVVSGVLFWGAVWQDAVLWCCDAAAIYEA